MGKGGIEMGKIEKYLKVLIVWVAISISFNFLVRSYAASNIAFYTDKTCKYRGEYWREALTPLGYTVKVAPRDMFTNPDNYDKFKAVIIIHAKDWNGRGDYVFYRQKDYDGMKTYVKQGGILIIAGTSTWVVGGKRIPGGAVPDLLGAKQMYARSYSIDSLSLSANSPLKIEGFAPGKWISLPFDKSSPNRRIFLYEITTAKVLVRARVYKAISPWEKGGKKNQLIPTEKFGEIPSVFVNNYGKGKVITIPIVEIAKCGRLYAPVVKNKKYSVTYDNLYGEDKIYFNLIKGIFDWALPLKEKSTKYYRPDEEGFIRDWLICGPFPNPGVEKSQQHGKQGTIINSRGFKNRDKDFLIALGGELKIEPESGMKVEADFPPFDLATWSPGKAVLKWREYHSDTLDVKDKSCINLGKVLLYAPLGIVFPPPSYIIGYAFCYVESSKDRDVLLSIGSDDGNKIWLNHHFVGKKYVQRGARKDQDIYSVHLKKGMNPLLIKIDQVIGAMKFCLRFLDLDKNPIRDVKVRLKKG